MKDLRLLVDENLDTSQQCVLAAQRANCILKCGQQVNRGDSVLLLCSGEIPPGVLHPALEPPAQEGHGAVGVCLEEGHKDDPRAGVPLLRGKTERVEVVQPGEEKAAGRSSSSLPVPEGVL